MNFRVTTVCFASSLLCVSLAAPLVAWEVVLRGEVVTDSAVIRLGDIAEVSGLAGEEMRQITALVLAPGPSQAYARTITASHIRKMLTARGIAVDTCQFSGAPRTVVSRGRPGAPLAATGTRGREQDSPVPWEVRRAATYRSHGGQTLIEQVEEAVSGAVVKQLQSVSDEATPWDVAVMVPPPALHDLPAPWEQVAVEGLENPVAGEHRLVAHFTSQAGATRVPVSVTLTPQVQAVMAVRAIPRGTVVQSDDVVVRHVVEGEAAGMATRLEEVVGRCVQQALRADTPIPLAALRKPTVIRRRDEIEIVARRGCVVVRDKARAIDDGAVGDVISVEKFDDAKTRLVARVIGVRQAEVFASGVTAMSSAPAGSARTSRTRAMPSRR